MDNLLLMDAEAKLQSDHDGFYKTQLIEALNKCRDIYAIARQSFLPLDEHQVVESMEAALTAALAVIQDHQPSKTGEAPHEEENAAQDFCTMINV